MGGGEPGAQPGLDLSECCGDVYALADDTERARALALIGKPGDLVAQAKLSSLPEWQRWREHILATLEAAPEPTRAAASLDALRSELATDEQVASSLYRSMLTAHMGGQLFVREVEVPESAALDRRRLDATDVPPFFRQAFSEALQSFLGRRLVTPDEWAELSDAMKARAFTATRLASDNLIARAQQLLTEHLANGGTLRSFTAAMQASEVTLGVEPSSPHYLELIYRNATNQSYGAGRLAQLEQPAVLAARPYVQYRTAGDVRVRPTHAALNGVTFDRSRDPGWRRYAPPLGHQCRCSLVTVRQPGNVTLSTDLDVGPDPGWVGPGMA